MRNGINVQVLTQVRNPANERSAKRDPSKVQSNMDQATFALQREVGPELNYSHIEKREAVMPAVRSFGPPPLPGTRRRAGLKKSWAV